MPKLIDLTGQPFNRLTVLKRIKKIPDQTHWECVCTCGNIVVVKADHLKSGHTRSCGCLQSEAASDANMTHGHSIGKQRTHEFSCWIHMRNRCSNPKHKNWHRYGGRGITVCDDWENSYEDFFDHIGPAPSRKHSIERIDTDGNYEPGNVCWATQKEQANNMHTNRKIEFKGETKNLSQWADIYNISPSVVRSRLVIGWDIGRALTEPLRIRKSRSRQG
jgi:hypothetical protein